MQNTLLIVHPETTYDQVHRTREDIIRVLGAHASDRVFVLENSNETVKYLNCETPLRTVLSSSGEIADMQFLDDLLHECGTCTIIGHTGNCCHHTAFEAVLRRFVTSPGSEITILLPSSAISSGNSMDMGNPMSDDIFRIEREMPDGWVLQKLGAYRHYRSFSKGFFSVLLSRKELATLMAFVEYVCPVLFVAEEICAEISIDGRVVGESTPQSKKLRLALLST